MTRIAEQARFVNHACAPANRIAEQVTDPVVGAASASPALLAANERLLALRQARHATRAAAPLPSAEQQPAAVLPAHLGWGSARLTAILTRQQAPATPTPQPVRPIEPLSDDDYLPFDQPATTIRLHPSLGLALLHAKQETAGRIWLLCRHLDHAGRGWLPVDRLRQAFATPDAPHHVCGWRRLRQILHAGDGLFWTRDASDRIWLRSTARVAEALHVERLAGRPVELQAADLCGSIRAVRAQLYAAFHSGRRTAAPISRATLRRLTSVAPRTQRAYDALAGVRRTASIAVGAPYSADTAQEMLYTRGRHSFVLTDRQGRQGAPGRRYLAWRLPNTYHGPQPTTARGRQRKINRRLRSNDAALVTNRAQGNSVNPTRPTKIYHTAARIQPSQRDTVYWFDDLLRVWHAVPPVTKANRKQTVKHKQEISCRD